MQQFLFYTFAASILTAAVLTVTVRNVFHSALYLALSLFGVAAVFALLGSYFLAGLQILLYVGAVVVLSIFVISMTKHITGAGTAKTGRRAVPALLTVLASGALLTNAILRTDWGAPFAHSYGAGTDAASIGSHILSDFVIPFEAVSVLLLAALIGAIAIIAKDGK